MTWPSRIWSNTCGYNEKEKEEGKKKEKEEGKIEKEKRVFYDYSYRSIKRQFAQMGKIPAFISL